MKKIGLSSDTNRLNEELQQALQNLEKALRSRDDFLAIVSHDLKNPLAAILMSAELLEKKAKSKKRRT